MSSILRVIFDPDTTPPSTPTLLSVTAVSQSRLDVVWTPSVDTGGSGLAGYDLLKDDTTVIPLGNQTSYSDTGLAASSSHTYRVRGRDSALNVSPYSNQGSGTTAAAPAPYNPAYPRLGSYAIGGQQLAAVNELRRRHVNIVVHYPGWQQSKGISLASLCQQVKAASSIGTKMFAYLLYSDLAKTSSNDGSAYREVYDYVSTNNLWAYTNGQAETGQLDSQYNPPNYWKLNYTSSAEEIAGKTLGQWYLDWGIRLNRDGGTFSVGSSNRVVDPNTSLDGLFIDNVFFEERVNADYDRDGSLDGLTNAASRTYIQTSHAALAAYYRALWPDAPILANSADWCEFEFDGLGSFSTTALNQQYEGGVIETVQNYEVANHFQRAINAIKVQMDAYKVPKLGVVEVNIASATDYRFMRYWLGISLLTDTYYYPNLGSYLTQDLPNLWFDEFNFNLGAATEPVQTAPRYNTVGTSGTTGEGVWRRDFANGIVLVGARRSSGGSVATGPSGDQDTSYASVSLGGTFYRLVGTQDAATNTGASVTSVVLRPRDAIVLSRTPVDTAVPSAPTSLSATAVSSSAISLTWNASTDTGGSGLAGYKVERSLNGTTGWSQIGTPTSASYSDTGLSGSTQYFYRVRAYDNAQNHSGYSTTANATTASAGGGVTTSVVRGVLNVNAGAGTARIYFKWTYPTTNVGGSRFHDLKTGKLYVGTSPGGTQLVNGLDFSTTSQKCPSRCVINGLQAGQTIYARVRAVNSLGIESADSGEYSAVAAVYVEPTRANSPVPGNKNINAAGEYRITSGTTGPININANNVHLSGWNDDGTTKRKLVHGSGVHGIVLQSGVTGVRVTGIDFDHSSGSGDNIRRSGAITNCKFDGNDFEMRSNAAIGSGNNPRAMNGCEVFGNTTVCTYPGGHDDGIAMVSYASGFTAWNNDFTLQSSSGRCAMFGGCPGYEAFGNAYRTTGATSNAGFHSAYGLVGTTGPQSVFIHDNLIDAGANAGTLRLVNFDGEPSVANDSLRHRAIWNTFTVTQSGSGGTCIRVRNPVGPVDIAFNTFNNCNSTVTAISFGNDENGGGSGIPYGGYLVANICVNFGTGRPLYFEGGQGWQLILQSWDNIWGGEQSGGNGDWYMNRDSLINGIQKVQASDWRAFNCTIGGSTSGITSASSWVGSYNPLLLTPSAPSTPTAVTGIA